ncbi:MAG: hypothetical protein V4724_16100 [Pseudomonadota bacterium]
MARILASSVPGDLPAACRQHNDSSDNTNNGKAGTARRWTFTCGDSAPGKALPPAIRAT